MSSITLKYPETFIAFETDPRLCRDLIKPAEAVKKGDLLIKTSAGFKPYRGTQLEPSSENMVFIAVALGDAEAGKDVPCLVRCAVVILDLLNHTKADDFEKSKPLNNVAAYLGYQQLKFVTSVNAKFS